MKSKLSNRIFSVLEQLEVDLHGERKENLEVRYTPEEFKKAVSRLGKLKRIFEKICERKYQ